MRRPNIERAISLASRENLAPKVEYPLPPTLQYSRCSWQCIMKIGRETCYPWRAFKSWINFFLPPWIIADFSNVPRTCASTRVRAHTQIWRPFHFATFVNSLFPFPRGRRKLSRGSFSSTVSFSSSAVGLIFFSFFSFPSPPLCEWDLKRFKKVGWETKGVIFFLMRTAN